MKRIKKYQWGGPLDPSVGTPVDLSNLLGVNPLLDTYVQNANQFSHGQIANSYGQMAQSAAGPAPERMSARDFAKSKGFDPNNPFNIFKKGYGKLDRQYRQYKDQFKVDTSNYNNKVSGIQNNFAPIFGTLSTLMQGFKGEQQYQNSLANEDTFNETPAFQGYQDGGEVGTENDQPAEIVPISPEVLEKFNKKYDTQYTMQQANTNPATNAYILEILTKNIDEEDQYKSGGIHIKKSKRGSFTRYAKSKGMSVQEAAHSVMRNSNNTALRKKAQFAINAAKWKHQFGGPVGKFQFGGLSLLTSNNDINDRLLNNLLRDEEDTNPISISRGKKKRLKRDLLSQLFIGELNKQFAAEQPSLPQYPLWQYNPQAIPQAPVEQPVISQPSITTSAPAIAAQPSVIAPVVVAPKEAINATVLPPVVNPIVPSPRTLPIPNPKIASKPTAKVNRPINKDILNIIGSMIQDINNDGRPNKMSLDPKNYLFSGPDPTLLHSGIRRVYDKQGNQIGYQNQHGQFVPNSRDFIGKFEGKTNPFNVSQKQMGGATGGGSSWDKTPQEQALDLLKSGFSSALGQQTGTIWDKLPIPSNEIGIMNKIGGIGKIGGLLKNLFRKDNSKVLSKDFDEVYNSLKSRINSPEGKRRLSGYNETMKASTGAKPHYADSDFFDRQDPYTYQQMLADKYKNQLAAVNTVNSNVKGFDGPNYINPMNTVNLPRDLDPGLSRQVIRHELEHGVQQGDPGYLSELLSKLSLKERSPSFTPISPKAPLVEFVKDPDYSRAYFTRAPQERGAFLSELQQRLLDDKYINHPYDNITPELLQNAYNKMDKSTLRMFNIIEPTYSNFDILAKGLNRMVGIAGPAYIASQSDKKQMGGNVNTTGYTPGTQTENNPYNIIPGGNITMQGVNQNINAIPMNNGTPIGKPVRMKPGLNYYFPNADSVLEIPEKQWGGPAAMLNSPPVVDRLNDPLGLQRQQQLASVGIDPRQEAPLAQNVYDGPAPMNMRGFVKGSGRDKWLYRDNGDGSFTVVDSTRPSMTFTIDPTSKNKEAYNAVASMFGKVASSGVNPNAVPAHGINSAVNDNPIPNQQPYSAPFSRSGYYSNPSMVMPQSQGQPQILQASVNANSYTPTPKHNINSASPAQLDQYNANMIKGYSSMYGPTVDDATSIEAQKLLLGQALGLGIGGLGSLVSSGVSRMSPLLGKAFNEYDAILNPTVGNKLKSMFSKILSPKAKATTVKKTAQKIRTQLESLKKPVHMPRGTQGTFSFQYGGEVQPNFSPIQTEKGERLYHLDRSISAVGAKKLHKNMKDNEITDIVQDGTFVLSRDPAMRISKKEANEIILGNEAIKYEQGKPTKPPKDIRFGDILTKRYHTPSDIGRIVDKKFPISTKENNIFTKTANEENLSSREMYMNVLKYLTEIKKPADLGTYKYGGKVKKYQAGAIIGALGSLIPQIATMFTQSANKNATLGEIDKYQTQNQGYLQNQANVGLGSSLGGYMSQDFTPEMYNVQEPLNEITAPYQRAMSSVPQRQQQNINLGRASANDAYSRLVNVDPRLAQASASSIGANTYKQATQQNNQLGQYRDQLGINLGSQRANMIRESLLNRQRTLAGTRSARNQANAGLFGNFAQVGDQYYGGLSNINNTALAARMGARGQYANFLTNMGYGLSNSMGQLGQGIANLGRPAQPNGPNPNFYQQYPQYGTPINIPNSGYPPLQPLPQFTPRPGGYYGGTGGYYDANGNYQGE